MPPVAILARVKPCSPAASAAGSVFIEKIFSSKLSIITGPLSSSKKIFRKS
jgi:hypothetical protein